MVPALRRHAQRAASRLAGRVAHGGHDSENALLKIRVHLHVVEPDEVGRHEREFAEQAVPIRVRVVAVLVGVRVGRGHALGAVVHEHGQLVPARRRDAGEIVGLRRAVERPLAAGFPVEPDLREARALQREHHAFAGKRGRDFDVALEPRRALELAHARQPPGLRGLVDRALAAQLKRTGQRQRVVKRELRQRPLRLHQLRPAQCHPPLTGEVEPPLHTFGGCATQHCAHHANTCNQAINEAFHGVVRKRHKSGRGQVS
ncbi:MAG: hypothetical protein BWX86_02270 [Verrucomicrobia bacterium ADurb.Bin122]|nr:MAG: hypothetical protein BWX86_02270 [Verrucomicrobia bacterium ADurb.Bin122]